MSSAVGGGSAAGQRCEFYVALVCETPALVGPLQTLISVVPTLVSQAVSIDLRPGVAAVLHHEERQSAATAAVGLAGRMGRSAAPDPLAAHPRLLLRIAHRTGDGRRAKPAPGVEHVLHKDGKWVGLCARGGGTVALGDALDGWQLHLSWVGGLSPLDVLSTYSVFLGRPGHLAAVPAVASAAAEMAVAAEALVVADHPASQGPMTAPREPCAASPAAKLFSLPSSGGGGVPAVPRVDADGEELVGGRRTPAVFDRSAPTPFDVEYLEYRPGRKAQPFRRHTRQDARCPLCQLDARTVSGLLDHLRALHTDVSVELFRAVSAAELEGAAAAASSGGGRGWDRYLAHIRWVSTPMLLPGLFESAGWVQSTAGAVRPSSRLPPAAVRAAVGLGIAPFPTTPLHATPLTLCVTANRWRHSFAAVDVPVTGDRLRDRAVASVARNGGHTLSATVVEIGATGGRTSAAAVKKTTPSLRGGGWLSAAADRGGGRRRTTACSRRQAAAGAAAAGGPAAGGHASPPHVAVTAVLPPLRTRRRNGGTRRRHDQGRRQQQRWRLCRRWSYLGRGRRGSGWWWR